MNSNYLLTENTAQKIYHTVQPLPIIDYHCHLSPMEIYEDKPFENIGEMWLSGDHYKWRLMRNFGIDEKYITGDASYFEKFEKYITALSFAAGNPLYHWSQMELSMYFNTDFPIKAENAQKIWNAANEYIKQNKISPRYLIKNAKVEYIATTDDMIDSLCWHRKISQDKNFQTKVTPSFRTDNLLLIKREGYQTYKQQLEEVSGISITDINSLRQAVVNRLDYFCAHGCKFTDVGIPIFPSWIADDKLAEDIYLKACSGQQITDEEYMGFLGNMYLFLGKEYAKRNLVMQWHLNVYRNANTQMLQQYGADCGCDCVGDSIKTEHMVNILDSINQHGGLPKTILYTLDSSMTHRLTSIAGSYVNVLCGAAWWFCDQKRGIENQIETIAEQHHIGTFLGMLTDSRSFLSYARHDYFRRIFCNLLAKWCDEGEYNTEMSELLAKRVCYENIKDLIENTGYNF